MTTAQNAFGYHGIAIKNPYLYSLPAATWLELLGEAQCSFAGTVVDGVQYTGALAAENFQYITTESGQYLALDGYSADGYFDGWLLAIIAKTWFSYIISGPTLFSWGQIVLANPASVPIVAGQYQQTANQVYNPNLGQFSMLNSASLYFVPVDYPAGTLNPI